MPEFTLHLGDSLALLPTLPRVDCVVTDPPYPNNAGHFSKDVDAAREFLAAVNVPTALVFWSELEHPPVRLPLVAVHVWHRWNVNGRPYEPLYHFDADGRKRRSEVRGQAAIFNGVGPGCREYADHPTQKPIAWMEWAMQKAGIPEGATVLDPFMGSGTTGVACMNTGRSFIGIEIDPGYHAIAKRRIEAAAAQLKLFVA